MHTTRRLAGLLTLTLLIAACSSAGAPSPSAPTSVDPNTPVGTDAPPGGGDPGDGGGFVEPKPGQLDVHPVALEGLTASVDGRRVLVIASWTSGVEPCYTLDTILVDRDGTTFSITVQEGHGADDVACIEIAQMKQSRIDLGELDPGTYTVVDSQGGAAPIEVVVS